MKNLILYVCIAISAGCSNLSDMMRFGASATSVAVRSGVANNALAVQHAMYYHGYTGGAAVGAGTAIALGVETPKLAKNGNAVPITIVGLNLLPGENALIYANNCEVMEVVNYSDNVLQSLKLDLRLPKSATGEGIVRVESIGREASSELIKVSSGGEPCDQNLGLNMVSDIDFALYANKPQNKNKSIKLKANYKSNVAQINASISHPTKSSNTKTAHYITNILVMRDDKESIIIKTTPSLSKNPRISLSIAGKSVGGDYTMLWRDNSDNFDHQKIKIN